MRRWWQWIARLALVALVLALVAPAARAAPMQAGSGLEVSGFEGGTLYTSTEPCAMCCGAIYWAGIRRVVFACSHETLNKLFVDMFPENTGAAGLLMSSREIFARGGARTEVVGPYLEQEAVSVHKKHWPKLLGIPVPAAWRSRL
jgi:tRNA(Arg) A34 adenosine deaminase TadA